MVKLYRSPWPCCTLKPKKRRHRDGYADNDTGLLAQPSMTASEFLRSKDPTQILAERFENSVRGRRDRESCAHGSRGAGLWGRFTCIVQGDFRSLLKSRDGATKLKGAR